MSHACSAIKGRRLFFDSDIFYSRLNGIMQGLVKRDLTYYPPLRLRQKLSITLTILQLIVKKASEHPNPKIGNFLKITAQFGWGFGLRTGDYAELVKPQNGHRFTADVLYYIFDIKKEPICICDWHLFPPNTYPLYMAILPDLAKNSQCGEAPMRAVPANPDTSPGAFCLIRNNFDFFKDSANRPTRGQRIFERFNEFTDSNLRSSLVEVLKQVAIENGLPAELMHLHGFRPGTVEQLSGETAADQDAAGGWNHSVKLAGGRLPYIRETVATVIAWANRVCASLYRSDHTSSIAQLKWMHTTPISSALSQKRKRG